MEMYNEWQQEMAEKMARERAQRAIEMHVAAESVSTELIAEVTADLCRDISRSCIGQEWDAQCEEQTADSVLQTLVQAQVVELAEAEHRILMEKQAVLLKQERRCHTQCVGRTWKKWKHMLAGSTLLLLQLLSKVALVCHEVTYARFINRVCIRFLQIKVGFFLMW